MEERHSAVCLMQFLSSAVGCKHAEVTEAADLILSDRSVSLDPV